jgi:uncharacterized protein YndB with AHSA1/START domain
VEVRSDRRWRFEAEPAVVWAAIGDVTSYRRWWPWLVDFDARGLESGDLWTCAVKPPLPYTVRFTIELDEVIEPRLVTSRLAGDLRGTARLELEPAADGASDLRLVSALGPTGLALRALSAAARPVARYGHDWILDSGAAQFASSALPQG